MKIDVKISGLEGVLDTLQSLPAEVVSKRGGPVKLALAKGARLIRDAAKQNLRTVIRGEDSTGLLLKSVLANRGKAPSNGKGERYLVRVKKVKYPARKPEKDGTAVTPRKTGQLLEYGSSYQPATPWLRPAVQKNGQRAITVITEDLKKRIDKVVQDLGAKNGGR
jgi:HK97 gp10 family phage protein